MRRIWLLFILMLCLSVAPTTARINIGDGETGGGGEHAPPDESDPPVGPMVPIFNSRPDAPATLFLDFDGHYQRERVGMSKWLDTILVTGDYGWEKILTPRFDRDGAPLLFSAQEQQEIHFIWASVAEDYAPFNINVTTVDPDPGTYHPERPYVRVVISGAKSFRGEDEVGFADTGAYADGEPNVAYVFSRDKDNQPHSARTIAEGASHEAGHLFGLRHYSKDAGDADAAPIMRSHAPDDAERGVWARGCTPFSSACLPQDDMAKIAGSRNGFGYRPDDHADDLAGATPLTIATTGLGGHGVIETPTDVDTFRFETGGSRDFGIVVDTPSVGRTDIGNLAVVLELYDAHDVLLQEDRRPDARSAALNPNLPAGTYYVKVSSYGAYGDVGQYSLLVAGDHQGPRIVRSAYASLSATLASLAVTFDEPINPYFFTPVDVRINNDAGGVGVVSVGPPSNGGKTFLVTVIKPTTTVAWWNIYIGPNITDVFGNPMDQNQNGVSGESSDYFSERRVGGVLSQ